MSRTLAFVQARMSSSRFPGKVLAPLNGVPMVLFMVDRVRKARSLDGVVVLTSEDRSDDVLNALLVEHGVSVFRGNLDDVLDRYVRAAVVREADVVVRLTADCPLIDPSLIDRVVEARRLASADYASNFSPRTYPSGFEVECFTRATLERAGREATEPAQREHVTPWMRDVGALSKVAIECVGNLAHVRLTVDYPDDLDVVRAVVDRQDRKDDFDLFDVLRVVDRETARLQRNRHHDDEGIEEVSPRRFAK